MLDAEATLAYAALMATSAFQQGAWTAVLLATALGSLVEAIRRSAPALVLVGLLATATAVRLAPAL